MGRTACPGCTDGATVGPLCSTHRDEVDRIAVEAAARVRGVLVEVFTEECPVCCGHGDVPSGSYSEHNPTGLVTCTRCDGEGRVAPDAARFHGRDASADVDPFSPAVEALGWLGRTATVSPTLARRVDAATYVGGRGDA
jgi:hypothetical protein